VKQALVRDDPARELPRDYVLREDVGRDEEAEHQEQRRGDEELRRDGRTVVVDLGARGPADRAAGLDHGAAAVCADQMLAAHLETPSDSGAQVHLT
jgi:hypothetical protein